MVSLTPAMGCDQGVVARSQPEQDSSDDHHRQEVDREPLKEGRHAVELLEPVDAALHLVALPIQFPVKGAVRTLVVLVRV